ETGTLTKLSSVTLPEQIHETWAHPSGKYLYAGWSDGLTAVGKHHGLSALKIDQSSGALQVLNEIPLPGRMTFVTTDVPGMHVLVASPDEPARAVVYRIEPDGKVGSEVQESATGDGGFCAHQVRVDPSNKMVLIAMNGTHFADRPAQPGSLKVYGYKDGVLTN